MIPIRWVLFWTLVALITAVMSTALFREWNRVAFMRENLVQKEQEVESLNRELVRAKERLEFYKTPKGKARLAREQFNLVLPGERIYRLSVESAEPLPNRSP